MLSLMVDSKIDGKNFQAHGSFFCLARPHTFASDSQKDSLVGLWETIADFYDRIQLQYGIKKIKGREHVCATSSFLARLFWSLRIVCRSFIP